MDNIYNWRIWIVGFILFQDCLERIPEYPDEFELVYGDLLNVTDVQWELTDKN